MTGLDLSLWLPLIGVLTVSAALAGFIAGLLGVGGGIVHVPVFFAVFMALGYDGPQLMQVCVATSLAVIVVTSVRSLSAHHAAGAVDWTILRSWAPGIVVGALTGAWVAARLNSEALEGVFALMAGVVALYLLFGRVSWRLGESLPTGGLRVALSGGIGFLSVLMGIGGGSFGVPIMTLYGLSVHRAVATAAGFGLLIATPSVGLFLIVAIPGAPPATLGAVNGPAFALAIAMTWIITPMGARAAHRLDATVLRRIFGAFVLIVAANMAWSAL